MAVFFEGSAKHCCHTTLKLGSRGVELSSPDFKLVGCFFLKNPDYVRGVIFRLADVHLLIRANVMLYFPTTFACRCDLIKVPPATQYNVHV